MNATVTQPGTEADTEDNSTASQELFNRFVGLSEVETMTGRNRGQISRDAKSGRLPYSLNEQGQRQYKVSDLYQVYGFRQPAQPAHKEQLQAAKHPPTTPDETAIELQLLRQQVQSQADQLRRAEDDIRDLRQHRDRLTDQNQRLTLLLTGPTAAPQPAAPIMPAEPPRHDQAAPKSWLDRIFNR